MYIDFCSLEVSSILECSMECAIAGRQLCVGYNYIWDPATMDLQVCEMFVKTDNTIVDPHANMYLISV